MEVLIYFEVQTVTPDPRQYNQQRQVYTPLAGCNRMAVPLELIPENFVGVEDFNEKRLLWELGKGDKPEIPESLVTTPLGWSRVMEKLEEPYQSSSDGSDESLWQDEPTDF